MNTQEALLHRNTWVMFAVMAMILVFWQGFKLGDRAGEISKLEILAESFSEKALDSDLKVTKLQNRVKELEAVEARSKDDIKNYILTYYKTTPPTLAGEIATKILRFSATHGVPFVTVVGMMEVESQFNPYAISRLKRDPARGLMQVRFGAWKTKLGLKSKYDLHDISMGIETGIKILRLNLDSTKDNMRRALYMYISGVAKANDPVVLNYVRSVYEAMGKFVVYRSFAGINEPATVEAYTPGKVQIRPPEVAGQITQAPTVSKPFIHTVKHRGETLSLISKWYTGSIDNWQEVHRLNPEIVITKMKIGATIMIPNNKLKRTTPLMKEYIASGGKG